MPTHRQGGDTEGGLSPRGWGGRTGLYPTGRPSKGGANRSSNTRRVIRETIRKVTICPSCGGVDPEVTELTEMWQPWGTGCPANHTH